MKRETWAKLGSKPPATDEEALSTLSQFTNDPPASGFYRAYRQVDNLRPPAALIKVVRMVTGDYPEGS